MKKLLLLLALLVPIICLAADPTFSSITVSGTIKGNPTVTASSLSGTAVASTSTMLAASSTTSVGSPVSIFEAYGSGGQLHAYGITAKVDLVKAVNNIGFSGWNFGTTFNYTAPAEYGRLFSIYNDINNNSWIINSYDGYSWSPPNLVASGTTTGHRYWVMAACADSNGNLWAIQQDYVDVPTSTFNLLKSTDLGVTWTVSTTIPFAPGGIPPVQYSGMVQAPNGQLIAIANMAEAASPETGKVYAISIDPTTPATQSSTLIGTAQLGEGNILYDAANGALVTVQRFDTSSANKPMVGISLNSGTTWSSTLITNAPANAVGCSMSIAKMGTNYLIYTKDRSWTASNYLGIVNAATFLANPATSVNWVDLGGTYGGFGGTYSSMSGESGISVLPTGTGDRAVIMLPIANAATSYFAGKYADIDGDLFAMVIDTTSGTTNPALRKSAVQIARGGPKMMPRELGSAFRLSGNGSHFTGSNSTVYLPSTAQLPFFPKGIKETIYQGPHTVNVVATSGSVISFADGSTISGGSTWTVPAGTGVVDIVYIGSGTWRPYITPAAQVSSGTAQALGTAAFRNIGVTGATVPLYNATGTFGATNTFTASQTFGADIQFTTNLASSIGSSSSRLGTLNVQTVNIGTQNNDLNITKVGTNSAQRTFTLNSYNNNIALGFTGSDSSSTLVKLGGIRVTGTGGTLVVASSVNQIYTGTGGHSFVLPAISGNAGAEFLFKNRGSGSVTVARAGSDEIYTTTTGTSFDLIPGQSVRVVNDGTYWTASGPTVVASGTVVLVSGTASVVNPAITTSSSVVPTLRVVGGTVAGSPVVQVFAGTATFTGAVTDTSTWSYMVINP